MLGMYGVKMLIVIPLNNIIARLTVARVCVDVNLMKQLSRRVLVGFDSGEEDGF